LGIDKDTQGVVICLEVLPSNTHFFPLVGGLTTNLCMVL